MGFWKKIGGHLLKALLDIKRQKKILASLSQTQITIVGFTFSYSVPRPRALQPRGDQIPMRQD